MKTQNLLFFICIFALCFLVFNQKIAIAASSNNDNYNVEIQNIDTAPEKDIANKNTKPELPPQTELRQISDPLSFYVSQTLIDFGQLASGNPAKRTTTLSVNTSLDYQILSYEDHPLTGKNNQILADTTCDNGSCSEISDSQWINELTYGFGYSTNNETYMQFADLSKHEKPQVAMAGGTKKAEIIFKANLAPAQKPENLSNTVTFIAIPNF